MQMPRSTVAVEMLKEAGLPYVVVLTNPTTGGVTASYAMLGDIQIAEPGALICFAGPRVIEQTIRETLPEGFQRAEYLLDHGMLDRVVPRKDLRDELAHHPAPPDRTSRRTSTATCRPRPRRRRPTASMTAPSDRVLDRLTALHPKVIDLTLDRIERLLAALGHPERRAAAGGPRRRHQRQGLGGRDAPRRPRGRRARASTSTPRRTSPASTSASASPASSSPRTG